MLFIITNYNMLWPALFAVFINSPIAGIIDDIGDVKPIEEGDILDCHDKVMNELCDKDDFKCKGADGMKDPNLYCYSLAKLDQDEFIQTEIYSSANIGGPTETIPLLCNIGGPIQKKPDGVTSPEIYYVWKPYELCEADSKCLAFNHTGVPQCVSRGSLDMRKLCDPLSGCNYGRNAAKYCDEVNKLVQPQLEDYGGPNPFKIEDYPSHLYEDEDYHTIGIYGNDNGDNGGGYDKVVRFHDYPYSYRQSFSIGAGVYSETTSDEKTPAKQRRSSFPTTDEPNLAYAHMSGQKGLCVAMPKCSWDLEKNTCLGDFSDPPKKDDDNSGSMVVWYIFLIFVLAPVLGLSATQVNVILCMNAINKNI